MTKIFKIKIIKLIFKIIYEFNAISQLNFFNFLFNSLILCPSLIIKEFL